MSQAQVVQCGMLEWVVSVFAGDARTANDALKFLQGFMERFPAYQGRPFWVAGESYGGRACFFCSKISTSRRRSHKSKPCACPCRTE